MSIYEIYACHEESLPNILRIMSTKSVVDRIDHQILAALQEDARLSNKELATRVGLAPSTCSERFQRLVSTGTLLGFHAEVNREVLSIGLEALISVRIVRHSRKLLEKFQSDLLELTEVVELFHLAGANDFLIHVAVRDADHLRTLTMDQFTTRAEVEHMETALIFGHDRKSRLPNYAAE